MRDWNVGTNSYYKKADLILDEGPWYAFLTSDLIMLICSKIPPVPIPFGTLIKITRDDQKHTVTEYYGNIADLFHMFVCSPVTQWAFKKIKTIKQIPIDYNARHEFEKSD